MTLVSEPSSLPLCHEGMEVIIRQILKVTNIFIGISVNGSYTGSPKTGNACPQSNVKRYTRTNIIFHITKCKFGRGEGG